VAALGRGELDVTDRARVAAVIERIDPEVVVNCAAHTGVDACETERWAAWQVNALGPRHLADALRVQGGRLVHVSTDYVFDGRKPRGEVYLESDPTAPLSVYGRTKLAGEEAARTLGARHVIVRTAWLYGIQGRNFLKTILGLAVGNPGRQIKVVDDQIGSPTWSHRLALQIARLIAAGGEGLYHAAARGACTWYDLAAHFLAVMEVPCRLVPCTSAEYPTAAARPGNAVLENRRLEAAGIQVMEPWREDVTRFARRFRDRLMAGIAA
jgi:dTDP-4-dehydrorhamnose reductase